ncbi:LDLR chaperone boca, partial [Hyalella azteca]|uniref:LDLR chaperone boca n=2 Tax=Hyalella azteca TaxID=294128 RepID=A0A8B7PE61_HYAAZ
MATAGLYFIVFLALVGCVNCRKHEGAEKPEWAKKDIRDYNDADLERLLDQWEEDEEPLEPDELPEHLRPQPQFQFDPTALNDPEQLLKASKKGRSLMMFVKVKSKYSKNEVEEITKLWQGSLHNNHVQAERYMVDDQRAIFMFGDGSQAWDAKDFLVQQEQLEDCTIDNKVYPGHHTR